MDGVAGMMRQVKDRSSLRRNIERLDQEETGDQGAIREHRRIFVKKPDKWVTVRPSSEKTNIKRNDMKLATHGETTKTVSIKVQLPPGFLEHPVRRFDVPENENVGIIQDMLSKRFGVERGQWRLYGNTKEGSKLLKREEPIKKYDMKETTLYFYPEY